MANQGKRKGLGGERSGLFFKFSELIESRRPRWLVIGNVPGLLNSHNGRDFQILLQTLAEFGYGLSWRVLDAKYFGTPQRRRRVCLVGSLGSLLSTEVLFDEGATSIAPRQGIGKREISPGQFKAGNRETNCYAIQHASIGRNHLAGPQAKGYRNDGEAYTLDSRGSADAVAKTDVPFRMRKVAGVSPGMDGNRPRAIGNAVCGHVVEWLGKRIIAADKALNKEVKIAI